MDRWRYLSTVKYSVLVQAKKYHSLDSGMYKNHFVTSCQVGCTTKIYNILGLKQHNVPELKNL